MPRVPPTQAPRSSGPQRRPRRLFPFLFPVAGEGYTLTDLQADLMAGLTTAVMLVPQAMGYAVLAGLPPIHGLYASFVPLLAYAVFGTSRQLAVGPVAMDSLLVVAGLGAIAQAGSERFIAYAVLLAALVGGLQLLMGIGRLGFLVNFLSRPVISGFNSAAALIIASSQLTHWLGFPIERSAFVHQTLAQAIANLQRTNWPTLAIGLASMAVLMGMQRWLPKWPRGLVVVVLFTGLVGTLGIDRWGVSTVQTVPRGLPSLALPTSLTLPTVGTELTVSLLPLALAIAVVGYMEAIAVGTKYAQVQGYSIDANRELIGLGMANVGASLTQGYPITGGLSRTAVNAEAGAKSKLAGVVTACAIALTLLFLTPLFYYLPKAVLASIIITAAFGLIDVREAARLWHIKRVDCLMLLLTFVATLGLGIQQGIGVGVVASLTAVVVHTTRPHVAVLGRIPGTGAYRNIKRFPEAQTTPGVLILRLDAQFYFGNVNFLKETLRRFEQAQSEPLQAVVLDASGVNRVDASAETALCDILEDYRKRHIDLILANVKGPVFDVLERSGFIANLGEDRVFLRVEEAMEHLLAAKVG